MKLTRYLAALALALCVSPPAWAHGEAIVTDPQAGGRVGAVPRMVTIDFTQPPTKDSVFQVVDGCGADVLSDIAAEGDKRHLKVSGGEPGKWQVGYKVISATDGHRTEKRFTFTVAGKKDCRDPQPDDEITPDIGVAAGPVTPDGGSSFPIIPVIIGGGIVIIAVAIRMFSSR